MKAGITSYLANVKRSVFSGAPARMLGNRGPNLAFSLATVGTTAFIGSKLFSAGTTVAKKKGNIGLYQGLFGKPGDNIVASGKRGIDANVGGTTGLVHGFQSKRRRY